jgi:ATP-binding cassette subfamily B protein RaxB
MERALEAVGLLDEVERLPQGFATLLSAEATILSTGQRRRLLAARAICRSPRLYLLDEVTANLDPVSERALVDGLVRQPGAKVFVTHSPALLTRVDTVYAVEDGRLVRKAKVPVQHLELA